MTITDNPASIVDHDAMTVRRSITIAAPVDAVWAAITEPELVSRWFGRLELAGSGAGAAGTISWDDHGSIPIRVESMDPPRSVSYRWNGDDALETYPAELDAEHSTVFTFTLTAIGDGTRLEVVETGFGSTTDPAGNLESHAGGWVSELDELVELLEASA